jgi:nitrite reductase/ring-hydroxylating ferredoxin subunit
MARDASLICPSDCVQEGGKGVRFDLDVAGRQIAAFVVRFDGMAHAYINCCPHAGTELDWQPGEFFDLSGLYLICATHGAMFVPDTGRCVGGPCKGCKLSQIPLEERDGRIHLTGGFTIHGE